MILVTDSTHYLPMGGRPSGIFILEVEDGGIIDIKARDFDKSSELLSNPSEYLVSEINQIREFSIDTSSVTFGDLFLLQDGNIYLDEIAKGLSVDVGKRIDGVFIMDTEVVENLLGITGPVEFEKVKFDDESLLVNLDLLAEQSENPLQYRKSIITNIMAVSSQTLFNDISKYLIDLHSLLLDARSNKELVYRFYSATNLNNKNAQDNIKEEASDYVKVSAISNPSGEEERLVADYKIEADILVRNDFSTRKTISIDTTRLTNLDSVVACVPLGSSNFSFSESIDESKAIRFGQTETCIRFDDTLSELKFSFDTISFHNTLDDEFNYIFGIRKQPGANVQYDIEVLTEALEIEDSSEGDTSGIYTGDMNQNKVVGIKLVQPE